MHTYKKVLPVAMVMALAACGGGSETVPDQSQGASFDTHARFNPVTFDLPLNTDLVFAAAAMSDGTSDIGAPTNPVEVGINALDGFSTNAPFDIYFAGGELDEASIKVCQQSMLATGECAQSNVFVLALNTEEGGDPLDPDDVNQDAPFLFPLAEVSASVISLDGEQNNVLRITPYKPLLAATKYLVFVTTGLQDTDGNSVSASQAYNVLGESEPPVTGTLLSVRNAIQGWEALAAGFIGVASGGGIPAEVAKASVVVSYTFTTTDPITPLLANAAPKAAIVQAQQKSFGVDPNLAVQNLGAILMEGVDLNSPEPRAVSVSASGIDVSDLTNGALEAGVVSLYTGLMDIPYYLRTPETTISGNYKLDSWQPDQALGAVLLAKIKASLPVEAASQLPAQLPLPDADGSTFNVTYRYPFVEQVSLESVPLQLTLPNGAYEVQPGVTCGMAKPDGLPVVMYVHGIGSDRTSVVSLAHSLAKACVATVAIDLPLHGARAFEEGNAAFNFINLGVLTNTRDNLRQSVMDLLNLNASLSNISVALEDEGMVGLDTRDVKVVGVSLGGIVGATYATVNQLAVAVDGQLAAQAATPSFASKLNPLSGLVISAAGGQVTQLLINSESLGPSIENGLAAEGVESGSSDFENFLYVTQSIVDSGDPVNFAEILAGAASCDPVKAQAGDYASILTCGSLTIPVLVQQIVGGGDVSAYGDNAEYLADQVVPNSADGAPLAGTTPLARLLNAQPVAAGSGPADVTDVSAANALVNLTVGEHASLLTPGDPATAGGVIALTELQTETVSFVVAPNQTAVGITEVDLLGNGLVLAPTAPYVQMPTR
ncbi:MECDP-synthase [Alcanivorax sp. NBRC 101098]|uniref:hypothetical protein n=1 Tax=Alcanivorax sp. NBRC 101098 TaxID=1113728 RepID=UPI0004ABDD7F|nr:hypothetical protein [Alcanivorax sp. NBRC 101098]BAP13913.1 MECDP-synthase [Alcanivorax sp. NBRC 101098]